MKYSFNKRSDGWWQLTPWAHSYVDELNLFHWFMKTFGIQGDWWDNWGGCFFLRSEQEIAWFHLAWAK